MGGVSSTVLTQMRDVASFASYYPVSCVASCAAPDCDVNSMHIHCDCCVRMKHMAPARLCGRLLNQSDASLDLSSQSWDFPFDLCKLMQQLCRSFSPACSLCEIRKTLRALCELFENSDAVNTTNYKEQFKGISVVSVLQNVKLLDNFTLWRCRGKILIEFVQRRLIN